MTSELIVEENCSKLSNSEDECEEKMFQLSYMLS